MSKLTRLALVSVITAIAVTSVVNYTPTEAYPFSGSISPHTVNTMYDEQLDRLVLTQADATRIEISMGDLKVISPRRFMSVRLGEGIVHSRAQAEFDKYIKQIHIRGLNRLGEDEVFLLEEIFLNEVRRVDLAIKKPDGTRIDYEARWDPRLVSHRSTTLTNENAARYQGVFDELLTSLREVISPRRLEDILDEFRQTFSQPHEFRLPLKGVYGGIVTEQTAYLSTYGRSGFEVIAREPGGARVGYRDTESDFRLDSITIEAKPTIEHQRQFTRILKAMRERNKIGNERVNYWEQNPVEGRNTGIQVIRSDGTVVGYLNSVFEEGDTTLDNIDVNMGPDITNRLGKSLYNIYVGKK